MVRAREYAAAHFSGVTRGRVRDNAAQVGVFLDEFRHAVDCQADHVVDDQDLAVAVAAGADADGRDGDVAGKLRSDGLDRALDDDRESAGFLDRLGVAKECRDVLLVRPLIL